MARAALVLTALCAAIALPYAVMGPQKLREDWIFARYPTGGYGSHRPGAWAMHRILFADFPPMWLLLVLSTVAMATTAWLLWRVCAEQISRRTAWPVALVWAALPIHTSLRFWASGLYITVAAALALQALRTLDRRSAIVWSLLAASLYEVVVLPVLAVALLRRRWSVAIVCAGSLVWAYVGRPDTYRQGGLLPWRQPLDGVFGLSTHWGVGIAVLLVLAVHRRDDLVRLGVLVALAGIIPFANQRGVVDFAGLGDRGTVISSFGMAMAVAAVAQRWRAVAVVVAALALMTAGRAVQYGRAADAVDRSLRCITVEGDRATMPRAFYGPIGGLTDPWNMNSAARVTTHHRDLMVTPLDHCDT